jgi:hypothetical protein
VSEDCLLIVYQKTGNAKAKNEKFSKIALGTLKIKQYFSKKSKKL